MSKQLSAEIIELEHKRGRDERPVKPPQGGRANTTCIKPDAIRQPHVVVDGGQSKVANPARDQA